MKSVDLLTLHQKLASWKGILNARLKSPTYQLCFSKVCSLRFVIFIT